MAMDEGDRAALDVVEQHERAAADAAHRFGGEVVKGTGDGELIVFNSVKRALEAATAIQKSSAQHGPQVRVGVHIGEPIVRADGDVSGAAVDLAARLISHADARAGSIWVSAAVRHLCHDRQFRFASRGSFNLKGFQERHDLFELVWDPTVPTEERWWGSGWHFPDGAWNDYHVAQLSRDLAYEEGHWEETVELFHCNGEPLRAFFKDVLGIELRDGEVPFGEMVLKEQLTRLPSRKHAVAIEYVYGVWSDPMPKGLVAAALLVSYDQLDRLLDTAVASLRERQREVEHQFAKERDPS